MTLLVLSGMGGIAPRVTPELLPDGKAQTASNVRLHKGGVAALRAPSTVATPTKSGTAVTIHRFGKNQPEGQYWFKWTTAVNVARGPIAGDTEEKTYYTGDGVPKETSSTMALTGGTDYPVGYHNLKLPAPTAAPTLTQVSGAGPALEEQRAYVYTNIESFSGQVKESGPSPAAIGTADASHLLRVSGFSAIPSEGPHDIIGRRIYRSVTSSSGTDYYLVKTVLLTDTPNDSVTDDTADTSVGEALPSLYWDTPPDDLAGLVTLPSGAMCGFSGKEVCFSEIGMPHAWPDKYRLTADYNIVAVVPMGQGVIVLTDGYPYFINSGDPSSAQMIKLDEEQACVSARSAVAFGGGVIYASPDGLVMITSSGAKILTDALYDREAWQSLTPSGIFAAKHDGRYYGFLASGGFILDSDGNFTTHDVTATACYVDPVLDQLYIAVGTAIQKWDAGAAKTHTWKSKKYRLPAPTSFGAAQVIATSYSSLTFKIYVDGTLKHTQTVTSSAPFRLPAGYRSSLFEFELSGTDQWTSCNVASTMEELKGV